MFIVFRITNSLVYYGLSLNTGSLSGNIFWNSFISGAVEVPANIICIFTMMYLGRKPTLVGAFLIAGVSSFLCIPFLEDEGGTSPPSQHVNHGASDVIIGFRFGGFSDVTDDDREGGDHGLVQRHLRVHGRVVSDARASRGGGVELDDGASGGHDSSVLWRTAGSSMTIMVIVITYRSSGYFGSFTDECLGSSSFRNIRYSQRRFRSGVDSAS